MDANELESVSSATAILTPNEADELTSLEAIIEDGFDTFIKVGQALSIIREKRLYRVDYPTFEEYVRQRWAITRQHAYRIISSAQVALRVSPVGDIPNERQARALGEELRDYPEVQPPTWEVIQQEAKENKITERYVRMVARAASEVTIEVIQTQGNISLDGESVKLIQSAIIERVDENQKRQAQHIAERTGRAKPDAVFECAAGNVAQSLMNAGIDVSEMVRIVVYRTVAS